MQETDNETPKSMRLEAFNAPEMPEPIARPGTKRARRTRAEVKREKICALIEREHALDGKSKTVNIERCFVTDLRVSNEVWEELRARIVDQLEQKAHLAEISATKDGRKTIKIQDII